MTPILLRTSGQDRGSHRINGRTESHPLTEAIARVDHLRHRSAPPWVVENRCRKSTSKNPVLGSVDTQPGLPSAATVGKPYPMRLGGVEVSRSQWTHRQVARGGAVLSVRDNGREQAPAVVLLTGLGTSQRTWDPLAHLP
ncbi:MULTISPECIES: hypothetical protein [Rhodococcus]|uniref:Hydrolase n=1 Tax=Rhodococcus opacus RKJ300 = JCM 13270 TaxID=1165867 RepID=I0WTZ5_RHOOP|nr:MULTISPECIES: hypothetical protein [Rhodococcus]EID79861.1 hypothetical protein W59_11046 [Rhodococcus opacus RKJ300 = JCM 13270]QQZ18217.1 hypothetical protein GO592_38855 [Rhodococcus sp. 21391]